MTIGVAAVIILVAVGNGSQASRSSRRSTRWGRTCCSCRPRAGGFGPGRGAGTSVTFTQRDADALSDTFNAPDVKRVSPVVNATGTTFVNGSTTLLSRARSSGPSRTTCRHALLRGRERRDVHRRRRQRSTSGWSCSGRRSSPTSSPAPTRSGRRVRVNGTGFQVVGVTAPKGSNGQQDQDDIAFAPMTAVQDALTGYGERAHRRSRSRRRTADALDAAQSEVTTILDAAQAGHRPDQPGLPGHQPGLGARGGRAPRPTSSRPCSARSPRSRCWSAGSA